jgi:predicted DNA-binding transcriptional regulator YafY
MKITPDLIQELLSYGNKITVMSPPELRTAMVDALEKALDNY